MDTTTLVLIVVVIVVVVLVVLYLLRRPGGPTAEVNRFNFDPATEPGGTPSVNRRVTILAPDQLVGGQLRKLTVDAQPLPADPDQPPPKEKGIDRLLITVINPRVQYADSHETVTNFDPPLTFTFSYSSDDLASAGRADGKPRLSIITFYQEGDAWRWERLPTDVDANAMTCSAQIRTLTPRDPCGMGIP